MILCFEGNNLQEAVIIITMDGVGCRNANRKNKNNLPMLVSSLLLARHSSDHPLAA